MANNNQWIKCSDYLPENGVVVETAIIKRGEIRNCQKLKRYEMYDRLWWYPDDSMYIYYVPTHWRKSE
jgi:hypothetical protein